MYISPEYAEVDHDEIFRLIKAHPFATVLTDDPTLRIVHVPIQLRTGVDGAHEVVAHVAAADPFSESVRRGARVVVSVVGPAVYISPSWYSERGLPTYNFVAIELHGICVPLNDPDEVRVHLMRLVVDHERALEGSGRDQWRMDAWARDRTNALLPELQAFTMRIETMTAKVKVSQNRSPADRLGVVAALTDSSRSDDREVCELMRARFDEAGNPRRDCF